MIPVIAGNRPVVEVLIEIGGRLVAQGCRSMGGDTGCSYGNQGNHCAVGFLLDDEDSAVMGSGRVVDSLYDFYGEDLGINHEFIGANLAVLKEVQGIHDSPYKNERKATLTGVIGLLEDDKETTDRLRAAFEPWVNLGKPKGYTGDLG